jgi:hypothetical protein
MRSCPPSFLGLEYSGARKPPERERRDFKEDYQPQSGKGHKTPVAFGRVKNDI